MKTTDEKKAFLEGLKSLREKRLEEAQKARLAATDKSRNYASGSLDKDILKTKTIEDIPRVEVPEKTVIRGSKPKIDTNEIQKMTNIDDFWEKINAKKIAKAASKAGKAIPVIGAIAAGLGSEDASAAVPMLGDAESAGMSSQDENQMMAEIQARKDYDQSPAAMDRMEALKRLKSLK